MKVYSCLLLQLKVIPEVVAKVYAKSMVRIANAGIRAVSRILPVLIDSLEYSLERLSSISVLLNTVVEEEDKRLAIANTAVAVAAKLSAYTTAKHSRAKTLELISEAVSSLLIVSRELSDGKIGTLK